MEKGSLSHLVHEGGEIAVRVTPRAARARVTREVADDGETAPTVRIYVTEPPEEGRATEAARKALARVLGIAPSRLTLVMGATARDKRFRIG
jgi:uncharacterized protein YggU (UPF0235/DUF167 family)